MKLFHLRSCSEKTKFECLVKNESGTHILTNSQIRFSQKQGLK